MKAYWLIIFSLLLILFDGCRKKDMIEVSGNVRDPYTGAMIADAEVEIAFAELRNASYTSGYEVLGSSITDVNGAYQVSFERVSAVNYRVRAKKDGFFFGEEIVAGDAWGAKEDNVVNLEIYQASELEVNLVNRVWSEGQILFRMEEHSDGCGYCCSYDQTILVQGFQDTTFVCSVYGNQTIDYSVTYVRLNAAETVESEISIGPGLNQLKIEY